MCICGKHPRYCECHQLPTREEMVELAAKYRGQRGVARALGVSRPVARAFLVHYGLLSRGGRPGNGGQRALKRRSDKQSASDGPELREAAGWPPLEKWESKL